ncbi:hypothetical protein [Stenotrophomonas geniculata]|uniref:hypothetical protein n=1 Tax=Stenotrophomonas geniculata TaxID=86188 RepID=UPI002E7AA76E|nr:hypothetical protein [Stenotrophomonas geniculata]
MTADVPQCIDQPNFREVGHVLARLSGVDLSRASRVSRVSRATACAWEARGLALIAFSREDRIEAERIMTPVSKRRRRGTNLAAVGVPKEEA